MLDPEVLRAFITVAERGHFVRSADQLKVTQSVISKRLKRLEDQLGVRLLERGKRSRVALTRVGELFLPEARRALMSLERAENIGRGLAKGEAGPLRMGYVFSAIMTGVLPRMIRALRSELPAVEVQPIFLETPEQLSAIEAGSVDFGIARARPVYPPGIVATTVHREDVVVAMSSDHRLVDREHILALDLIDERLIVPQFHEEVGLVDIIRGVAKAAAAPMPDFIRTTDFITAAGLAAGGAGIVIAPRSLARLALEGLCYRDLADHAAFLDLVIVRRAGALSSIERVVLDSSGSSVTRAAS